MTPDNGVEPPELEKPAPPQGRPIQQLARDTNQHQCNATGYVAGLHRRRAASGRVVPLDCGCRDPWPCRCTQPPLSQHALDGWRRAANHVLAAGNMPVVPLEVRRALWRRGGGDRALAERLHRACGEVIA